MSLIILTFPVIKAQSIIQPGEISVTDLKKATEIDPWLIYQEEERFKLEVALFEINIISGGLTYSYKSDGRKLSTDMKKVLNSVKIGQKITFKINVRGIDGTIRYLEPFSIKVSAKTEYTLCPPSNNLKFVIFFETAKFELSIEAIEELNKAIEILKKEPDKKAKIIGFTDTVGAIEKNIDLSNQRAKAAADFIISKGVSKERINFSGNGAQVSAETVKTDRRVEIELFND